MERSVVYECFWGQQVSGNPRALIKPIRTRLPGIVEYWVIDPGSTYAPEGMSPLVRWSAEWYSVLASAGLVVSNAALPSHFQRRSGQTVLQTWHGTPLKRLGLDMLTFEHMGASYTENLRTRSAQWSLLLAPNEHCSEVYPGAFDYDGQLLEVGSPRNDVLARRPHPARPPAHSGDLLGGVFLSEPCRPHLLPTLRQGPRDPPTAVPQPGHVPPPQGPRHRGWRPGRVRGAMKAKGQAALCGRDGVGDQGIAWRGAHAFADAIGPARAGNGAPTGGDIEQGLGQGRDAVTSHCQPFARAQAIGQPAGKEFEQAGGRLGYPLDQANDCLLYTSPSPRDRTRSRMPSSA